jgi:hypothetical protein
VAAGADLSDLSVYTPYLDGIDADRLADPRAPPLIFHELTPAIDGRHPLWESPRYTLERLCRYREERTRLAIQDADVGVGSGCPNKVGPALTREGARKVTRLELHAGFNRDAHSLTATVSAS